MTPFERKQLTVLFADLCGYTSLAESLDPEELRDLMEALWARLDPVITRHGGLVNQHVGDELMALFGSGLVRESEPQQAVLAALDLQVVLAEFRAEREGLPLQMRVGLNTGAVVLGPLGTTQEFTASGDTVNLASRLEHHAPEGGILISRDTYRQVRGLFDVEEIPPLTVKGKAEPVEGYLVLRAKPRAVALRLRGLEGIDTPMIGREREFEALQQAFIATIAQRRLSFITITGEAGIGKTRLLDEFKQWVELRPERVRLFSGRASEETFQTPFGLIRDVLFQRFEIQESDSVVVAREKFEQGFIGLTGDAAHMSDETVLAPAHFIGQLLGLDFSASPHLRGILHDPEQIRQRASHYLGRFFAEASQGVQNRGDTGLRQAAGLLLEDIHWSDEGSLELVEHVARACRGAPLMILCLARPTLFERFSAWGDSAENHSRLELSPLPQSASRTLVGALLHKTHEIPPSLCELVIDGAEGIPFYIEETIKMLIDIRVIVPDVDRWHVESARLGAATIPASLTGILQARLDGLSQSERTVLQRASVIGRTFWDNALKELATPADSPELLIEALAGLRRKELVLHSESSGFAETVEYTFKHDLLRKVAYEGLLKKTRRTYHEQVANWLVRQSGERVNEFAAAVAGHFEQAARPLEAAQWFGRAAQQAHAAYAPSSAADFFCKALALLPPEQKSEPRFYQQQIEWNEGLGEVLGAQAVFSEAEASYCAMRAMALAAGDQISQARAWNGLAYLRERQGDNRGSVENTMQAEQLAGQEGQNATAARELIRALLLRGWAFYRLSEASTVLGLAEQTLTLCNRFTDRRGMVISFKLFGVGHLLLGHFDEADDYFQKGLALCREVGDRRNEAAMLNNRGETARLSGDCGTAVEFYQQALDLARQIGHRDSEIIYLCNLSAARLGLHQFAQAETDLRQVILLTGAPNSCILSEAYSFLAEACLGQGKFADALNSASRGLELAKLSENNLDLGMAWRALGHVTARAAVLSETEEVHGALAEVPEASEARYCFQESLRVFTEINALAEQSDTLKGWAKYEIACGNEARGRHLQEEARARLARLAARTTL
jgi:class 3 adenylate cyclase/tetratricopeptide (TPR) repeat protein